MKKNRLAYLLAATACVFSLAGCVNKENNNNQTYDGRIYDISVNQDQSLLAKSVKVGTDYELSIYGNGDGVDYNKKEAVPWNPIIKKITNVTIDEGITHIGDYYFFSLPLNYFVLPSTVETVGDHTFNKTSVIYTYGGLLNNIENDVYYYSETKPTGTGKYFYVDEYGEPHPWILSTVSVLFIGNSFTYRGNSGTEDNPEVPADFKKIAENLNIDVKVDAVTKGSHTLTKFADPSDEKGAVVETKLTTNSYDYVILQEQSTTPINNYNTFLSAVKKLKNRINQTQTNCKTILYETWGTPYNTQQDPTSYGTSVGAMEAKLRTAYKNAGEEADCPVHYVGKAFTYAYETLNINIYADDNRHQNGLGAYLSAASHIRSMFKVNVSACTEYCGLDQTKCKALLGAADTNC